MLWLLLLLSLMLFAISPTLKLHHYAVVHRNLFRLRVLCPWRLIIRAAGVRPCTVVRCSPQDEGEVLRRVGRNERHVGRYVVKS